MKTVVFINSSTQPFVQQIMDFLKLYETRTRNTLGRFLGEDILIAETGKGKPVVRCSAHVQAVIAVYTREEFEKCRKDCCIAPGSRYDWTDSTKVKYLYQLTNVKPVVPFIPEGKRHGYVWMEV